MKIVSKERIDEIITGNYDVMMSITGAESKGMAIELDNLRKLVAQNWNEEIEGENGCHYCGVLQRWVDGKWSNTHSTECPANDYPDYREEKE